MRSAFMLLAAYLVVLSVLVGSAAGLGLLLNWAIPGVDVNTGLLVGTAFILASVFALLSVIRLVWITMGYELNQQEDYEDDEDDEDDEESPPLSVNRPAVVSRRHRPNQGR